MRKRGARIGHAEDVNEELAELENATADRKDFRARIDVREENSAHRRAGTRWANDPPIRLEDLAELPNYRPRLFPISGVESRLAAARLSGGKLNLHAEPLQHADHCFSSFRKELVHVAGDEDRDPIARLIGRIDLPRRGRISKRRSQGLASKARVRMRIGSRSPAKLSLYQLSERLSRIPGFFGRIGAMLAIAVSLN
jgi:hypothetical protein